MPNANSGRMPCAAASAAACSPVSPLTDRLAVGRRSSQRCVQGANQLPDTPTTRRGARVPPQDVHDDGRRKDPGLREVVESDGGIVSGGEFERACGMRGCGLSRTRAS